MVLRCRSRRYHQDSSVERYRRIEDAAMKLPRQKKNYAGALLILDQKDEALQKIQEAIKLG
ncbi:MAG: hypothetical protein V3S70_01305 [Gammaproteobacteria bacterium]